MMVTEIKVQGDTGHTYTIKTTKKGGLHCTCPAWKYQQFAVDQRVCKHISYVQAKLKTSTSTVVGAGAQALALVE